MNNKDLFLGIDIGTSGLRIFATTIDGDIIAHCEHSFKKIQTQNPSFHEQDPKHWWDILLICFRELCSNLKKTNYSTANIKALSLDGTSGTILGIDSLGNPTSSALMYNDNRAELEAQDLSEQTGLKLSSSSPLAKIHWLEKNKPETFNNTITFIHQTDFLLGKMTGIHGQTDYSNALKTGYDLEQQQWSNCLDKINAISDRLPNVKEPGAFLGQLQCQELLELGLSNSTEIYLGLTDGVAGFIASGAFPNGSINTSLGSTLIFKVCSNKQIEDPQTGIYSHRLPGNIWLPGTASNTGGEWLNEHFRGQDFSKLDHLTISSSPSGLLCYPMIREGERFPFQSKKMKGFISPTPSNENQKYCAGLEGVAYFERYCYQVLSEKTSIPIHEIYGTGAACKSDIWMQLRANITGLSIHRPKCFEAAYGSAILAAASYNKLELKATIQKMVQFEAQFQPQKEHVHLYTDHYEAFKEKLLSQI